MSAERSWPGLDGMVEPKTVIRILRSSARRQQSQVMQEIWLSGGDWRGSAGQAVVRRRVKWSFSKGGRGPVSPQTTSKLQWSDGVKSVGERHVCKGQCCPSRTVVSSSRYRQSTG